MATEMITLKLEGTFLHDIDEIVQKEGYQNRTEFIRSALRAKVDESRMKAAMMEIAHLRGASEKKTSAKGLEKAREEAFKELGRRLK